MGEVLFGVIEGAQLFCAAFTTQAYKDVKGEQYSSNENQADDGLLLFLCTNAQEGCTPCLVSHRHVDDNRVGR
jgi:hypothetical protein